MKPTPQIENQPIHRSFPLTDYSFQATTKAPTTSVALFPAKKLRAFRQLSHEFFGAETRLGYVAEFSFFALITAISAWPIISVIVAVTRLVRNY